jgi:hypothetical protein
MHGTQLLSDADPIQDRPIDFKRSYHDFPNEAIFGWEGTLQPASAPPALGSQHQARRISVIRRAQRYTYDRCSGKPITGPDGLQFFPCADLQQLLISLRGFTAARTCRIPCADSRQHLRSHLHTSLRLGTTTAEITISPAS